MLTIANDSTSQRLSFCKNINNCYDNSIYLMGLGTNTYSTGQRLLFLYQSFLKKLLFTCASIDPNN